MANSYKQFVKKQEHCFAVFCLTNDFKACHFYGSFLLATYKNQPDKIVATFHFIWDFMFATRLHDIEEFRTAPDSVTLTA